MKSRRYNLAQLPSGVHWADSLANEIITQHPAEKVYTIATGISPSGVIHFGNFREVITAHIIRKALQKKRVKTRLLCFWDNFDRLRKVPTGVDASFEDHIGKPLSKIPDPEGEYPSYAEAFQKKFEQEMHTLGIDITYRDQTTLYEQGEYDELIRIALEKRHDIADILIAHMTEKAIEAKNIDIKEYRENFYPISVYSQFTGKDTTKILSYDGDMKITYICEETGKKDTINLREKHIAKLSWKTDWAMRWHHEKVFFESAGSDHAAPGSSYDVSSKIVEKVYKSQPPIFTEYLFVGIRGVGAKMSGSKGNVVSVSDLLEIYEPKLLTWIYTKKLPNQSFELAFDSEIYRQYDEYDREKAKGIMQHIKKIFNPNKKQKNISFRQIVGFGQIAQWDKEKLLKMLKESNIAFNKKETLRRLSLAKNWLTKYNQDELITIREEKNTDYIKKMSPTQKKLIRKLHTALKEPKETNIPELEFLVYDIPKKENIIEKELKEAQRDFFKDVYNLLIGKDAGPRLSTFLWAIKKEKVLPLLEI